MIPVLSGDKIRGGVNLWALDVWSCVESRSSRRILSPVCYEMRRRGSDRKSGGSKHGLSAVGEQGPKGVGFTLSAKSAPSRSERTI